MNRSPATNKLPFRIRKHTEASVLLGLFTFLVFAGVFPYPTF